MTNSGQLTVSVAVATYNGERYIRQQLSSILGQSYLPHEIIVCDDGSTDGTTTAIRLAPESERVRLQLNAENLGFQKNFEQAITRCSGEIIALSDQDDIWLPDRLQRTVECFASDPALDLVVTEAQIVDEQLRPFNDRLYGQRLSALLEAPLQAEGLIRSLNIKGCTIAMRARLKRYVLPIAAQTWGHDHWIAFIAATLSRIAFLPEPLMYYRRHASSAGHDIYRRRLDWRLRALAGSLALPYYKLEDVRWQTMLHHLQRLQPLIEDAQIQQKLSAGIALVSSRQQYAARRLSNRQRNRFQRILPATQLLLHGDYSRFEKGFRTFAKDLIA
ncbi:MAG TPA: glycosyltransferase [Caldilineaceae bacterium]|nr:glycosyltransferase [Caldilineaceae bacterium]